MVTRSARNHAYVSQRSIYDERYEAGQYDSAQRCLCSRPSVRRCVWPWTVLSALARTQR